MIDGLARGHDLDGVGGLLEKERRLAVGIGAHLARVRGVIAPDAVDSPHREYLGRSGDRDERCRHEEGRA